MGTISHCPGNFPYGQLFRCGTEALEIAAILGPPVGHFQSEGDRFSMNAVRPADFRSVLELVCAALKDFAHALETSVDEPRGIAQYERLSRVHDIIRRQPVVQPARGLWIAN